MVVAPRDAAVGRRAWIPVRDFAKICGSRRLASHMPDDPIPDPYANQSGGAGASHKKTSSLAILSLTSSISGFLCFPALGGLLGVVLGVAAKSEISRDNRSGGGMALSGIVLGGLNLVLSAAALAALLLWLPRGVSSSSSSPRAPATVIPAPPPVAPPTIPFSPPSATPPTPSPKAASSRDRSVTVTTVGKVDLVDLSRDAGALTKLLDAQHKAAARKRQKLVLWLVVPDCKPCNGVAASLPDARMQTALAGTRLVRVDVREFVGELAYLGLPSDKIPGFAILSSGNRPVDYVHGGEWDEDVAANIAPVLSKFVRGSLSKRRHPWRGTRRDDETTL